MAQRLYDRPRNLRVRLFGHSEETQFALQLSAADHGGEIGRCLCFGLASKGERGLNNLQGCHHVVNCFAEEITSGENGEMIYNLLLEYASGGTLADLIEKSDGCGLREFAVRRYARSILRGLKHIHECSYVHCDLKPENILLVHTSSSDFVAKIGDFGLVKRVNQSKKRRLDPYLRGAPLYLSPEALVGSVQGPPSDIWDLGCVVLEMLTGKPPWDSIGEDLLSQICNDSEMPKIPIEISKEGKDFLKGCFVRKAMCRWTAEMLLNHPFVAGLDEEDGVVNEFEVSGSGLWLSLSEDDDDDCSSYFSDDWSSASEEDSSVSSWSGEAGEIDVQGVSSSAEEATMGVRKTEGIRFSDITPRDVRIVNMPTSASSTPMQQYQSDFTIPAGV